jgi:chromosome transmission fidelity protein 1
MHIFIYIIKVLTSINQKLVVLPYQHLLHENTRESLGISLKNNIVIIDEAHNLIETITSLYTVQLSQDQLKLTLRQLYLYIEKYKNRLLGKNVIYIQQIINTIKKMLIALENDGVMYVNDFTHKYGLDNINMFKIQTYLEVSQLARKLNGFMDKARQEMEEKQPSTAVQKATSSIPTLTQVQAFLLSLTNPDKDGRIVISCNENAQPTIKYMLLNPADVFKPVVDEAKSVVLAGGTMEPVKYFLYTNFVIDTDASLRFLNSCIIYFLLYPKRKCPIFRVVTLSLLKTS